MPTDSYNMQKTLEEFPIHCRQAMDIAQGMYVQGPIENVIILGMGGSGITGDLIKAFMHDSITPVHVIRDYELPSFVQKNSLVFAISYSGKTDETLSPAQEAIKRGAKVIGVGSGGQLQTICKKFLKVPAGLQPRCALGYLFFPILGVLANSQLIDVKHADLNEMLTTLSQVEDFKERSKTVVKAIKNRIPLVYSSEFYRPVAMRWKTQINENAKRPAFYNAFSELTHNEICSFRGLRRGEFMSIIIRDRQDDARLQRRMDVVKQQMEETIDVIQVATKGESLLARIFSAVYLGDWVAYHLAISDRTDPTPVSAIEDLKRKMGQ